MTWTHECMSSQPSTSSDSESDRSVTPTDSSTTAQPAASVARSEAARQRALVAIRRRQHAQRLAARRISQARAVMRARFLLGEDMSYAKLVVQENSELQETHRMLTNKVREMEAGIAAMRAFLERRAATKQ
ncbi:unnamed protein product, partial [Mesorhabditis spiculigera]